MTFNIITFGCKVNSYESEYIYEQLEKSGFKNNDDYKTSNIVIVNTCSVTNQADNKCMRMIRSIRKYNPECILVVCGCSAEYKKEEYLDFNIDILLGNRDKSKVVSLIKEYIISNKTYVKFYDGRASDFEDMNITKFEGQTRAFVKIQDGCNNFCSYCIIPFTRGNIRSKDIDEAYEEIKELVNNGHQEIVFTGIDTGAYGKETGKFDLVDLIQKITPIEGLKRIRVSSIEITSINDKFINELKNNNKLCGHLHVSLQSGSEKVLKDMNRKYTKAEYLEIINKIKEARPNINLTTDVIVGFPGETENDFEECVEFCKKVGFSKIHVFPYSKRDGTASAKMPNHLPNSVKKERARKLIEIDENLQKEYFNRFINTTIDVLIEEFDGEYSIGHTENFLRVKVKDQLEQNTIYQIKLKKIEGYDIIGNLE